MKNIVVFDKMCYDAVHVCDIIHSTGAKILGEYQSDFYAGMPAVTENSFGNGKAYYVAFRNDKNFAEDFCNGLIEKIGISPDCNIETPYGVFARKRGNSIFIMNFSDRETTVAFDKEYTNTVNGEKVTGNIILPVCGYIVVE